MKNSELIKQLKSLKEEVKTASRQSQMDEYIYERMQNIAGIVNEEEYKVGEIVGTQEYGYTDSGRGYITKYYEIVSVNPSGESFTAFEWDMKNKKRADQFNKTLLKKDIFKIRSISPEEEEALRTQQAAVDKFNADRNKQFGK